MENNSASPQIAAHTRAWVEQWIVAHSICPFAAPVVKADRLRYAICEASEEEVRYRYFLSEMSDLLDADPDQTETTLVIFPHGLEDFEAFLDFHSLCEQALVEVGLEGTFQIATFHPAYLFQGEAPEAASHYTNRAPYPILHLLREASVSAAVAAHEDPEGIPQRNIELMDKMGSDAIRERLAAIRESVA